MRPPSSRLAKISSGSQCDLAVFPEESTHLDGMATLKHRKLESFISLAFMMMLKNVDLK